jgi:hypothetical protein
VVESSQQDQDLFRLGTKYLSTSAIPETAKPFIGLFRRLGSIGSVAAMRSTLNGWSLDKWPVS